MDQTGEAYCPLGEGDYKNEVAILLNYINTRKPRCHVMNKYFCNDQIHDLSYYRAFVIY